MTDLEIEDLAERACSDMRQLLTREQHDALVEDVKAALKQVWYKAYVAGGNFVLNTQRESKGISS